MKDDEHKKKRGFFGRLIVFLLAILAFIGLLAIGLSVLGSYVNPSQFVWLAYFGLAFWVILLYNVVVFALLLLLWSRKVWIAIVALMIAIPGIVRSFSTGKPQSGGAFRVMSYNVMNFRDQYDQEKTSVEVAAGIAKMVRENHPDVLCLQEFIDFMPKTNRKNCIAGFGEMMGLPYYYYHTKAYYGGNVIFSRYPLSAVEEEGPFGEENEYGAVARVDAGPQGGFYVLCCHLTSFQLTHDEVGMFSESGNSKEQVEEYGKSIIVKLKNAYEKRSYQVSKMLSDIPLDGRPILLCGDFNDTPMSYTYNQIKRSGFTDTFVVAGRGIGRTYAGKLPLLRIDYIWANGSIQPMSFKRLKYKGSDHYPVLLDFNLKDGL